MKKRVIIVTDGDKIAQKSVEEAAKNIGGRCISMSAGNPTFLTGEQILELIEVAKYDPVIVMVDDKGDKEIGLGERAMNIIINSKDVILMGIVAVASKTPRAKGVRVDCSIDRYGKRIEKAVDKNGNEKKSRTIKGDTVNSLAAANVRYVVGIGDPGKMDGRDDIEIGAPIVTKAMEEIIKNYNKELTKFL